MYFKATVKTNSKFTPFIVLNLSFIVVNRFILLSFIVCRVFVLSFNRVFFCCKDTYSLFYRFIVVKKISIFFFYPFVVLSFFFFELLFYRCKLIVLSLHKYSYIVVLDRFIVAGVTLRY